VRALWTCRRARLPAAERAGLLDYRRPDATAGDAAGEAGEDGILCPASPVPAPHAPLFVSETQCYCARCRMPLVAA